MSYPVLLIEPNQVIDDEQLGSKTKFWFEHRGNKWLFKEARVIQHPSGDVVTGEDWAEKVAAEIAILIGVKAAHVELASFQGRRGSASRNFIDREGLHLEHGNEILAGQVLGYDRTKKQRQSDHTLNNIIRAISKMFPDSDSSRYVLSKLASYLVLDALVANSDRHHENWGLFWRALVIEKDQEQAVYRQYDVAPSFDHASSLGREFRDEKRLNILQNRQLDRYINSGRGGVYLHDTDSHGASPLALVEWAVAKYPDYFQEALLALTQVSVVALQATLDGVPDDRASEISKNFAKLLIEKTYNRLTGLLS